MKNNNSGFKAKNAGISIVVILAMLISGLAVLATPVTIAEENIGGPYGGSLRVALKSEPSSLNPLASQLNESATQIIDILYDSLGRIDPYTLEIKPWMASSWNIDPADTSIVSVVLKPGILWHDGTPVTLDDIEYTFGPNGYNIGYISAVSKNITSNTITFDMTAPDSRFFSEMMLNKIVPKDFTPTSAPKGCGPFKLVSSDSVSTVVEAFDDHFNARPYIDSMTYTYYPWDVDYDPDSYPYTQNFVVDPRFDGFYRAAYDLMTDKLDYIGWDLTTNQTTGMIELGGNSTSSLLLNANTTLVRSNGLRQWYLGFNNAPGHILNEVAIRKAISYAINKDALTVYDISGGLEKSDSIISKYNLPWYNSTITPHGYDVAAARKILDDANYMDYNSDGYIDKPGPIIPTSGYENISLTLLGPKIEDVTPYTMSTNIITWFEILGIKVTLISNTTESHMTEILADNFDMFLTNEESIRLDPQFLNGLYHSDSISTDDNLLNFQGTYKVDNSSLSTQIVNNLTWTAQLNHTNIAGDVMVFHNGTLVPDTAYDVDNETGLFTLDQTFQIDYANDTLNITYSYLPFDHLIEKANAQMDPLLRAKYIKEAQSVLADLEPSIPLFSYRISHAYKSNIFVDWVPTLGGINNYWSFTNIKNKVIGDTAVTLSSPKKFLTEGESQSLFVKVLDLDGAAIEGSTMIFTGEGTFGIPEYDAAGQQYTVEYTAPATPTSKTISILVDVYTVGYNYGSDTMELTIHPKVKTLAVELVRGTTNLPSGNETTLTVIVTDKDNSTAKISGATVVLEMTPVGLGGYLEEITGTTNAQGQFITTFGSDNVTIDTTFRITAYVSKEGYVDSEMTTSISVSKDPTIEDESTDRGFLDLPAPSFLAVLILLTTMSVVYATYRRKRN
uniref:HTH-type transcriptional regulator SgrR n=1 Tax=uncultured Thermoplasmata archaeon TaxID=376542 RepID=A0A871YCE6_9ARCH|nr:Extracellular solute-binding protein [uncultured Thermoplasmata archaeon]